MSPDNNHSVLTNANNNTPQQSVAGQQPYRMALQLPEGKRLKLQQHEQTKFQQQRQQGPIVQGGGHQQQQQHPMEPGAQGQQRGSVTYYSNPDYQQPSSASRPSFAQASSSYQPQIGPTSHSQQFHGQVQGNPQGNPYQYVQVPQQAQTQQSQNPSSNTGMNMKRGNPSAGLSAPNQNPNANYQMYNMAGLPSSARPATGSGRDGNEMMNMQVGNGSSYQDQATRLNMDSRIEASGSSSGGMADSGTYGEYGVQLSGSSIKSGRLAQQQAPLDVSASGMHPPADMPAFSSMPFEYGSSSAAGPSGTGTVSGYQVGSAPGTGNDMSHSFDQRGQSSVYQDKPNQGPSRYNSGKTQSEGQSGSVDQETFEFMRRKRWPQLLMQELVGAVVWCLIPYERRMSTAGDYDMDENDADDVSGSASKKRRPSIKENLIKKPTSGWKVVFASPAIGELLGVKPEEAEGRDWADFIHPLDLPRLLNLMQSAVENTAASSGASKGGSSSADDTAAQAVTSYNYEVSQARSSAYEPANMSVPQSGIGGFVGPGGSGTSLVDYVRMVNKVGKEVLFELKGHAHLGDEQDQETTSSPEGNGGFDGGGVMGVGFANGGNGSGSSNRQGKRSADDPSEKSVKAFWIMGRKWCSRNDAGGRMLEHFLELKLENERLKQELKDLQSRPFNSKEPLGPRSQSYATASFQPSHVTQIGNFNAAGQPKERTASADNTDDSGLDEEASDEEIPGVLRQAPQNNRVSDLQSLAAGDDSKKSKRQKNKNPEYLCRNCGRNDSPEWRKGPLGPKTLCNACGLRWAKKQAGPNNAKRKEKEKDKEVGGGGIPLDGYHAMNANRMDMS